MSFHPEFNVNRERYQYLEGIYEILIDLEDIREKLERGISITHILHPPFDPSKLSENTRISTVNDGLLFWRLYLCSYLHPHPKRILSTHGRRRRLVRSQKEIRQTTDSCSCPTKLWIYNHDHRFSQGTTGTTNCWAPSLIQLPFRTTDLPHSSSTNRRTIPTQTR